MAPEKLGPDENAPEDGLAEVSVPEGNKSEDEGAMDKHLEKPLGDGGNSLEKELSEKESSEIKTSDKKLNEKNSSKKKSAGGKKKKKSTKRIAAEFFIKIGVTALLIWALLTFVVGIYVVHSNTGYPMVKDGDLCIIYRLGEIYNGDEVAYRMDGKIRFARVVAMPGDVVDISEESMTINGYGVFEDTVYPTTGEGALIQFPYTVPEGTFFVLNDYRSDVTDSRTYGAIPKTKVKGKVVFMMRRRGF